MHEPELGRVAEPLLREALAWVAGQGDTNRGEWGDVRSPTFRPRLVQEMLQNARPRVRGKHSLLFLVLPVEGKTSWRVGESFFSVSKPLLHDLPAFKQWFEAQIPDAL
ncbi:hypothetical protein [Sinomonas sp. P47F7]|uniref:hypothetical protein n=1 Tax=Sinomonas sp. P47F7 TaxID=3410987 RepID=UPI003BF596F1